MANLEIYSGNALSKKPILVVNRLRRKPRKAIGESDNGFEHRLVINHKGISFSYPSKKTIGSEYPLTWKELREMAYEEANPRTLKQKKFTNVKADAIKAYVGAKLEKGTSIILISAYESAVPGRQEPSDIIFTIGLTPTSIRYGLHSHDIDSSKNKDWGKRFSEAKAKFRNKSK